MQNDMSWGKVLNRQSCIRMEAVAKATWDPANVWFGEQKENSPLYKDDILLPFFFYFFYESTVQYWSSFVMCYKSREQASEGESYSNNRLSRSKMFLICWCPDSARVKKKMLYSSTFDTLKKAFVGVHKVPNQTCSACTCFFLCSAVR